MQRHNIHKGLMLIFTMKPHQSTVGEPVRRARQRARPSMRLTMRPKHGLGDGKPWIELLLEERHAKNQLQATVKELIDELHWLKKEKLAPSTRDSFGTKWPRDSRGDQKVTLLW